MSFSANNQFVIGGQTVRFEQQEPGTSGQGIIAIKDGERVVYVARNELDLALSKVAQNQMAMGGTPWQNSPPTTPVTVDISFFKKIDASFQLPPQAQSTAAKTSFVATNVSLLGAEEVAWRATKEKAGDGLKGRKIDLDKVPELLHTKLSNGKEGDVRPLGLHQTDWPQHPLLKEFEARYITKLLDETYEKDPTETVLIHGTSVAHAALEFKNRARNYPEVLEECHAAYMECIKAGKPFNLESLKIKLSEHLQWISSFYPSDLPWAWKAAELVLGTENMPSIESLKLAPGQRRPDTSVKKPGLAGEMRLPGGPRPSQVSFLTSLPTLPVLSDAEPSHQAVKSAMEKMRKDPNNSEFAILVAANRILALRSPPSIGIDAAFEGNLRDFRRLEDPEKILKQINKAKTLAQEGLEKAGTRPLNPEHGDPEDKKLQTERGVGIAHARGERPKMEDTYMTGMITYSRGAALRQAEVYAIFDGHGGDQAAKFASTNLTRYLEHHLIQQNDPKLDEQANIFNALKLAMVDLSEACKEKDKSGTTAAIAIKMGGKLYVVNVGDSRVLIASSKLGHIQATEDASPADDRFKQSVTKRGSYVLGLDTPLVQVHGKLKVARALGDREVPGVTARPKITCYDLAELGESQVIIGCDGIFETQRSIDVLKRAQDLKEKGKSPEQIANALVVEAYQQGSRDNLSAMVIPLAA